LKIGLISDTHGQLRARVLELFEGVDLILHAGDIGDLNIITELEALAPVHAVHGNTDDSEIAARFGESVELQIDGLRIGMTHGHVLGSPTAPGLRRMFPTADVIVYGHTHMQRVDRGTPLIVNPGAAGPARFRLKPAVAVLELPELKVTELPLT
jgi:putative phosphoesterase